MSREGRDSENQHACIPNKASSKGCAEVCTGEVCFVSKLFLNAKQLVVLGKALATTRCTRLDLACLETNNKVSNEGILCLTRTVGHHHAPAVLHRHHSGIDGLSDGPYLIHLQKESIASLDFQGLSDSLSVCDKEVIANNLDLVADGSLHLGVTFPIVLIERIFN